MPLLEVSNEQYQAIVGALATAAEKYRENAAMVEKAWENKLAGKKLAGLFLTQAQECSNLLEQWNA